MASYPLFDESIDLQKILWTYSDETVKNPLLETQILVQIHVSTLHTWLGQSFISPEDDDGGELFTTREKCLPPLVIEIPLKLFSIDSSSNNSYTELDSLVSKGVIPLDFSENMKSTLSSCCPILEKIVSKKKCKWIKFVLVVDVERVLLETLEMERFEEGDDAKTGSCCGICLHDFSVGDFFTMIPCSHGFHSHCIFPWLNRSNSCPFCRFEIPIS